MTITVHLICRPGAWALATEGDEFQSRKAAMKAAFAMIEGAGDTIIHHALDGRVEGRNVRRGTVASLERHDG